MGIVSCMAEQRGTREAPRWMQGGGKRATPRIQSDKVLKNTREIRTLYLKPDNHIIISSDI